MEDLGNYKIIIYIVLAILYFLFTGKKKTASKPPVKQKEERPVQPSVQTRPEFKPQPLLKRTSQAPVSQPEPVPEREPYSLEDILKQFGQSIEEKRIEYQEAPEVVKEKVVDYDEGLVDEEQLLAKKDLPTESLFGRDDHYVAPAEKPNKYADMLKDPEGIKTAFIASEIFNRKYF